MLARLCLLTLAFTLPLHAQTTVPATQPEPPTITLITEGNVPAIKTAATLDELKKIEPTTLGDCQYRLALQSETIPFGEGVLIYALWDGKGTPPKKSEIESVDEKLLGPFHMTLTRKKTPGEMPIVEERITKCDQVRRCAEKIDRRDGECLSVSSIIPPRTGTYELTLTDAENNTIARTTLTCVENKNPRAFYPLKSGAEKAVVRIERLVLPKWDNLALYEIPKSLPTFMPAEDPTVMKATLERDQITLTAPSPTFTHIGDTLLVRAWINNKPLNLVNFDSPSVLKMKNEAARVCETLTFQLSLDPADYSAKPGDSVDIQFLYSAQGHINAPNPDIEIRGHILPLELMRAALSSTPVLLSNRLTLIPAKK